MKLTHQKAISTFLLIASSLIAKEGSSSGPLYTSSDKKLFSEEEKTTSNAARKQEALMLINQSKQQNAISSLQGSSDVMISDPKVVSKDLTEAFSLLKKRGVQTISFVLKDKTNIADVINVDTMSGGSIMVFTRKTVQGIDYQVIKTSDVATIESR